MAGRGTDILLGGNWEAEVAALENPSAEQIAQIKADWQKRHQQVIEAGGLHVIASERHESRRIDNQLRGRAGRQGDPGSSRFYLSLEDSLMRIFASDRVKNFMKALGMQSGEAIEHRMVTNAIEKAQRKVEGRNFDIRKQLLEYDDVANEQRKVIYHMRNSLLAAENIGDTISEFRQKCSMPPSASTSRRNRCLSSGTWQAWRPRWPVISPSSCRSSSGSTRTSASTKRPCARSCSTKSPLPITRRKTRLASRPCAPSRSRSCCACWTICGKTTCRPWTTCATVSTCAVMRRRTRSKSTSANPSPCSRTAGVDQARYHPRAFPRPVRREDPAEEEARLRREAEELAQRMQFQHAAAPGLESEQQLAEEGAEVAAAAAPVRNEQKLGRNEPCWCGSGKKFKHCHGQIE